MQSHSAETNADITRVKRFVSKQLDPRSALARVLLRERDQIPFSEFLAKVQVWLALLDFERETAP